MQAVRKCVDRLWLVQQDFLMHLDGQQPPQPVLFRYQHMFKGIKVSILLSVSSYLHLHRTYILVKHDFISS